jgi:hypothetical protein
VASGVPAGGLSDRPWEGQMPQPSLRVADSLAKAGNFIKGGFHIGRFVTIAVNTEVEQADV